MWHICYGFTDGGFEDLASAILKSACKQITELVSIFWYSKSRDAYANIIVFVHIIISFVLWYVQYTGISRWYRMTPVLPFLHKYDPVCKKFAKRKK